MLFKAKAPGRVTLVGEHAVLHNYGTLVLAINRHVTVTLQPTVDQMITLHSALGDHRTEISNIKVVPPFQFVLATLKKYASYLKTGCTIGIHSDFSDQIGLASSAAVTVALLKVLDAWLNLHLNPLALMQSGREIVQEVQGVGSGADVAAAVFGGMLYYKMQPFTLEKVPFTHPFFLIYSGFKTPTVTVIRQLQKNFKAHNATFQKYMKAIGGITEAALLCILKQDWLILGKLMRDQHTIMEKLGLITPFITELYETLMYAKGVLGAKISGAGLGDCLIGLGSMDGTSIAPFEKKGAQYLDVNICHEGVLCEQI